MHCSRFGLSADLERRDLLSLSVLCVNNRAATPDRHQGVIQSRIIFQQNQGFNLEDRLLKTSHS